MSKVMIDFLITKIKGETYIIDADINSFTLIIIILNKTNDYVRGFIKKVGIKGTKRNVFIGKKTTLLYKTYISFGNGVQIKDYVEINGLSKKGIILDDNASIGKNTIIRGTGNLHQLGMGLKIGKNFGCGDFCFFGCSGGITIGNDVIMGQNVRFHAQNHNFESDDILIKNQGVTSEGIVIGDNCWIGSGVVILDGVTIGNGCVIGANTLVTKNIPNNSLAVGFPAKVIRKRTEKNK